MAVSKQARDVTISFMARQSYGERAGMTTDGNVLLLYGNRIAEWRGDELWVRVNGIENANAETRGWRLGEDTKQEMKAGNFGDRPTTLAKLSLLRGVHVCRAKGKLYLNGKEWDGTWHKIEPVHATV